MRQPDKFSAKAIVHRAVVQPLYANRVRWAHVPENRLAQPRRLHAMGLAMGLAADPAGDRHLQQVLRSLTLQLQTHADVISTFYYVFI